MELRYLDAPESSGPPGRSLTSFDLLCFSHLRWDFVYQRPQHLLSRFSKQQRVFFIEEPLFDSEIPHLDVSERESSLHVAVPHLPTGIDAATAEDMQRELLQELIDEYAIHDHVIWCYTPMSLALWDQLQPAVTVYDCMDELSLFKGAAPILREREKQLLSRADLVFTGGQSLYEAKRQQHPSAHPFPSSIDCAHFSRARQPLADPADQSTIRRPRLGFYGVVDERFDRNLLAQAAELRPEWQFVILGPVAKIDTSELPVRDNIHYLGQKSYAELPAYLANWDVALLLFARNDATRFISPTKTPEYLAGGKPVVSTSIRDVVRPYADQKLVRIADDPGDFVRAAESALVQRDHGEWLARVDRFLATSSWDLTFSRMCELMQSMLNEKASEVTAESVAAD